MTHAPLIHPLPHPIDLLALQQHDPARFPLLMESTASGTAQGRWSLLLAAQGEGLRLDADGQVRDLHDVVQPGTFLQALDRAWQHERLSHDGSHSLPFRGGWALMLDYEVASQIEPVLPARAREDGRPTALALRCPAAVLHDHHNDASFVIAEAGEQALLDALVALASAAMPEAGQGWQPPQSVAEDAPQRFTDGVRRVIDYLRAGDVFQVNLSRRWSAQFAAPVSPQALYAQLRRANPAPFAGLFSAHGRHVVSSSPERLVSVHAGHAQTRPIAGTRPRFEGDDDAARIQELVGHPKERAEHVMLIDLERNDLGRICLPGTVVVDELMTVESYAHVHHIVSNVSGHLRPEVTPGEVIAATFPGGTITGCPKVRCMQIIAELEGEGRGPYTGALGYLNRDGDLDLNILIRSAWLAGDRLELRAGAGIVVDSDAARELEETRHKARGLLRALGDVEAAP
jgi:anthranilate synthase component 1